MDDCEGDAVLAACATILIASLVLQQLKVKRRWWVRPLISNKEGEFQTLFTIMKETDHESFFEYCRLEKWQFDYLLRLVSPHLTKKSIRRALSPEFRLVLTLRFLAHGGSIRVLAWNFRIGYTTARKSLVETCNVLWKVLSGEYVKVPSERDYHQIADEFWTRWNLPNCVGAIDGKHCALKAPPKCGSVWYNYKSYYSFVLLAACDARYQFTWVDCGGYGSRNDGGLFGESDFRESIINGTYRLPRRPYPGTVEPKPYFFVADAAFPLKENLMRPYPGRHLPLDRAIFNYRLSRARRVIENAFGILVARWALLQGKIPGLPKEGRAYVLAAIGLHNFIMKTGGNQYAPENFVDREEKGELVLGEWRNEIRNHTRM